MPSLTTVTLSKYSLFLRKKTIHTKSSSFFFPSFLDITPALQQYLQFIVSFTHIINSPTQFATIIILLSPIVPIH